MFCGKLLDHHTAYVHTYLQYTNAIYEIQRLKMEAQLPIKQKCDSLKHFSA
jgi:hypothetical protein